MKTLGLGSSETLGQSQLARSFTNCSLSLYLLLKIICRFVSEFTLSRNYKRDILLNDKVNSKGRIFKLKSSVSDSIFTIKY